jgi:hypothetical protein
MNPELPKKRYYKPKKTKKIDGTNPVEDKPIHQSTQVIPPKQLKPIKTQPIAKLNNYAFIDCQNIQQRQIMGIRLDQIS